MKKSARLPIGISAVRCAAGKLTISKDYKCECGAEYTALVSKWFVTTILKDPNDKEKPLQERLEEYQKRLFLLAE